MELKSLSERWLLLAVCAAGAIAAHAVLHLSSEKIAEGLSQPYVPFTEKQAKAYIKTNCSKKIDPGIDICHAPLSDAVQMVNALHRRQYEEEKIQPIKEHAREIRLNFAVVFSLLYAFLGLHALQRIVKWLRFHAEIRDPSELQR